MPIPDATHPSPLAEARERGGNRYKRETFPEHSDLIDWLDFPPLSRASAKGEGPGVG